MKKLILVIATIAAICFALNSNAQILSASKMRLWSTPVKVDKVKLTIPPVGTSGTIVLLTPDISLDFTRVQKINGNWVFGGSITPGLSYNLVIGNGTSNADGSVTVSPYFSIGAFADAGVISAPNGTTSAVDIGGCLGVYRYVTIAGGYDAVNNRPFIAVGAKISIFTFNGGSGATILSFK